MKCTRRQMVLGLLGLGGGVWVSRSASAHGPGPAAPAGRSVFEPDRRRAMVAAMERILPGAAEIGVPEHLEFWLRTEPFAPVRQQFDRAAEQLDGLARRRHQQAFADCAPGDQDALLKEFQEGKVRERDFDGANFFQRLVTFTMEGFLGDPKYGGNRREAGWRFVGHAPCWWSPRRIQRILNPDPRLKD